jgi:hypothetical protein
VIEGWPFPVDTLQRLVVDSKWGDVNLRLRYNVTDCPCTKPVMNVFLLHPELCAREVLWMCRLVQSYLHRNLHHHTAQHEGWVGDCALCRQWPGA